MHEYDIALKTILMRLAGGVLEQLTGFAVARWRNTELPQVRSPRVDLLGETADGRLVHIELQSTNDADMALRMAEYAWAIYRRVRRFPEQIVLYVGEAPLRMRHTMEGGSVSVRYRLVDIRGFDAEPLLASDRLEDNVIAVLMRLGDERESVRRILRSIADSEPARQGAALSGVGDSGWAEESGGGYRAGGRTNADFERHHGSCAFRPQNPRAVWSWGGRQAAKKAAKKAAKRAAKKRGWNGKKLSCGRPRNASAQCRPGRSSASNACPRPIWNRRLSGCWMSNASTNCSARHNPRADPPPEAKSARLRVRSKPAP